MDNNSEIVLGIGLNIKDAEKTAQQLQKEIEGIFSSGRGQKSAALTSLEIQMKKNYTAMNQYRDALAGLQNEAAQVSQFKQLEAGINRAKNALKDMDAVLKDTRVDFMGSKRDAAGIRAYGERLTSMQDTLKASLEKDEQAINRANERILEFKQQGDIRAVENWQASLEKATAKYKEDKQTLDAVNANLQQYNAEAAQALRIAEQTTVEYNGQVMSVKELTALQQQQRQILQSNEAAQKQLTDANAQIVDEDYQRRIQEEVNKNKKALDVTNDKIKQQIIRYQELESGGTKAHRNIERAVRRVGTATDKVRQSTKQASFEMSHGFTNVFKKLKKVGLRLALILIGVRSLRALIMKIRKNILEGFSNLKESGVGRLKQQMNDLTNATTTMKNALAGAFEPIIASAIPRIQQLVEWLTIAIDKLAQFIAAMKGQTKYIKAIKQVGDAGEKAKKQLAGFDELNVLSFDKNKAAGMFEEVDIPDEMIDKIEKLKQKIQEIKDFLDRYIFDPVKKFIAWFTKPITDNIDKIKEAISNLYYKIIEPTMKWIRKKVEHTFGVFKRVYEEYIKPSLDKIIEYVSYFVGKLLDFWNAHSDEFAWIAEQVRTIWDESIQPIIDAAIELFGAVFALITDFITSGDLDTLFDGLESWWDMTYPILKLLIGLVRLAAKTISEKIVESINAAKLGADTIRKLLEHTGSKWQTFKIVMLGIFTEIMDKIDAVISKFKEWFGVLAEIPGISIPGISTTWNSLETLKNASKGTRAAESSWTGQQQANFLDTLSGGNIGNIYELLELAKKKRGFAFGGVIPASSSEHLIKVGDNNHETEVVSPLSTIQDAMVNALQQVGFGGTDQPINIYLGTDKIYSEIRKMEKRSILMGG